MKGNFSRPFDLDCTRASEKENSNSLCKSLKLRLTTMLATVASSRRSRVLTDAAGVKIVMTTPTEVDKDTMIITETCRITVILNTDDGDDNSENRRSCGFHISRSKWDPYPWIGCVDAGSIADVAGLRAGDCLLEIDGTDLVGLRVKDIASLVRKDRGSPMRLQVWRSFRQDDQEQEAGAALVGPLPEVAKKLAEAISGTLRALECPVCLESATSPVSQCVHGHILCVGCRAKTPRCPICRVRLGQGRCLLADEVQRNIREAFEEAREDNSRREASLREKLFGKVKKKSQATVNGCNNSGHISQTKVKSSLARLLLGGFDKAASAENLSVATVVDDSTSLDRRPAAYRRLGELCQNDRTKSASTGELSKGNEPGIDSAVYHLGTNRVYASASGFLSVPQTPTWGGSTESINNASFACPLSRSTSCKETVTANFVLEHLSRSHEDPQVHFHGRTAVIPLPLPFGREASYIMHHRGELYFFQYEDEAAWMVSSGAESLGEWTLLGQNGDGTEVKLRRQLARLDDTSAPLPCHLAPLPKTLGINTLVIELMDSRIREGLEV